MTVAPNVGLSPHVAHERDVCRAALEALAERLHLESEEFTYPEDNDRTRPAVDMQFSLGGRRCVVEHTLTESFPEQIADGVRFLDLLAPLQANLRGVLPFPGRYRLTIPVGAVRGLRPRDVAAIRDGVEDWIVRNAPVLVLDGPPIDEQPDGVPFAVRLSRAATQDPESTLFIKRWAPPDVEQKRRERIGTALVSKCPKLKSAKAGDGLSILVLESDDIALADWEVVAEAFVEQVGLRDDAPDYVYLVETEASPWWVWLLKEYSDLYPHLREPTHFVCQPSIGSTR